MFAIFLTNALRFASGASLPLRKNIDDISSLLVTLPSYPFAPKPLLSVKTNSPLSLRPKITAGEPSHLTVTFSGDFSKFFNVLIDLATPLAPCQIAKSSTC